MKCLVLRHRFVSSYVSIFRSNSCPACAKKVREHNFKTLNLPSSIRQTSRSQRRAGQNKKSKEDLTSRTEFLEAKCAFLRHLLYYGTKPFASSDTSFTCRASLCGKRYTRLDRFNNHIRNNSNDPTHKMFARVIGQTYCEKCEKKFGKNGGLIRNKRESHGDISY